jgi:hypothetical protein
MRQTEMRQTEMRRQIKLRRIEILKQHKMLKNEKYFLMANSSNTFKANTNFFQSKVIQFKVILCKVIECKVILRKIIECKVILRKSNSTQK